MHTFSKFINYAIFCFLLLFSLNSIADDLLIFKKYGYGYGESRIVTDSPFFYPLRDDEKYVFLSPGYLLDDKGNKKLQSEINMFIRLFAEQKSKKEVVMTIEFENKSHHSFYLPDIFLTFFKKNKQDMAYTSSCKQDFLIITDNSRLDFLGSFCNGYDDDPDSGNWFEIKSGEKYVVSIYLNKSLYAFPPGLRRYKVGTLEYPFVNEQWLVRQRIYKKMFNLLSQKYICFFNKDNSHLEPDNSCLGDNNDDEIKKLLLNLDMSGEKLEDKFNIRSNQVYIDIDTNKS
ncbi:hypothetical protein [Escherichia fergusonii]|uniref:hypothetical protein n=1 Tax=Escherichia fergusonii TaxID=564 RepID=UPI0015D7EAAA|nr:hypothetical protein [Escherichia fergusonii]